MPKCRIELALQLTVKPRHLAKNVSNSSKKLNNCAASKQEFTVDVLTPAAWWRGYKKGCTAEA